MFEIKDDFYLNGKPFKIISGSIHYFRVVPEYWQDRLEKLKNMGCNTVETYIPWNFHEEKKGVFNFEGMHDVERFIQLAQKLGLYIIIRPSPYICAEWELGGLPSWLLAEDDLKIRCSNPSYLKHIEDYYKVLLPKLVPYQNDRGGNIILMQLENEYGYYGTDTAYLDFLADLMRKNGITVPFVTSDGPWGSAFKMGQQKEALPTANFGSMAEHQLKVIEKQIDGKRPLMCMEFWAGWFDAWGNRSKKHSSLKKNKKDFEYLVKNANVNIYMFHGGTNFGFMNGSNYVFHLTPDCTSYDYDAPLSESGQLTKKYFAFRKIIQKYAAVPDVPFTTQIKFGEYPDAKVTAAVPLFSVIGNIAQPVQSVYPLGMEKAGQNYGYILYRSVLKAGEDCFELHLMQAADRVQAFAGGKKIFTDYDKQNGRKHLVHLAGGTQLDFLVENMGRVNFAQLIEAQKKGINGAVCLNGHRHFGWEQYCLPLDRKQLEKIDWKAGTEKLSGITEPAFYRLEFTAEALYDTFIDFSGWGKGCIFLNGFNLGRFWEKGPQKRLYVPAPLLRKGQNEIIVFETEGKASGRLSLKACAKWNRGLLHLL